MPHSGAVLGADLYRLLYVARKSLPDMAERYLQANRVVAHTAEIDSRIFSAKNRVYPVWKELRDEYQRILAKTAENLINTGLTLERVVDYYASTDVEAAKELRQSIQRAEYEELLRPRRLPEPKLPGE